MGETQDVQLSQDYVTKAAQDYLLSRDHLASVRLNSQHWLLKQRAGYLIHPDVQLPDPSSGAYRVADIGAGTAIWATEASQLLQSKGINAQVDVFDIALDQVPPKAWLPTNLSLHEQDVFKPFPAEFHSQFDLIYIRAFTSFLTPANVDGMFDNLTALLKPGGYLQWMDVNPIKSRVVRLDPSLPSPQHDQLVHLYNIATAGPLLHNADNLAEPHGMRVVAHDDLPFREVDYPFWSQNQIMVYQDLIVKMAKASGDEERVKGARVSADKYAEEAAQGAAIHIEWFTSLMQKK